MTESQTWCERHNEPTYYCGCILSIPSHHPSCRKEVRKAIGYSYNELVWICVKDCEKNANP